MSLNAATIAVLLAKGLTGEDILEVARASENKADRTNAERQARHRAKKRNAVTVTDAAPNDIYSNPLADPVEADASTPPFEIQLVEVWNAKAGKAGARRSVKLDASRKTLLRARRRDFSEDEILRAVANIAASPFHCGQNDRGWRASLGWVLKAENFTKAIELGDEGPAATSATHVTDHAAYLASIADKPWMKRDTGPLDDVPRRTGNTGPPRSFGTLAAGIAGNA